jgi:hypothetical protein
MNERCRAAASYSETEATGRLKGPSSTKTAAAAPLRRQ